jgi:hypothetical protein
MKTENVQQFFVKFSNIKFDKHPVSRFLVDSFARWAMITLYVTLTRLSVPTTGLSRLFYRKTEETRHPQYYGQQRHGN